MPTSLVSTIWSQHGPLLVTAKYWVVTLGEIADGGTDRCVSVRPGSARLTNSPTKRAEQTLTSREVSLIRLASPRGELIPKIQRERPRQRASVRGPWWKYLAAGFKAIEIQFDGANISRCSRM